MKYTVDYLGPYRGEYLPVDSDHRDWVITAMTCYRLKKSSIGAEEIPNGCYQLFWPQNPWDALEKVKTYQGLSQPKIMVDINS